MNDQLGTHELEPIEVVVETVHGRTLVAVQGEIDVGTAEVVRERLTSALEATPVRHVVFDLRQVAFMDSAGVHLLLWLLGDARDNDYRLSVVRPPANVERVIEVAGLDAVMPFVDEPEPFSG